MGGRLRQNTLKGGGTEKRGRETKIFRGRRQARPRGGYLKKKGGGGARTPLRTMSITNFIEKTTKTLSERISKAKYYILQKYITMNIVEIVKTI